MLKKILMIPLFFLAFENAKAHEENSEAYKWLAEIYKIHADDGNPESAYKLGYLYNTGKGVDKNLSKAFKWYMKAAKGGLLKARIPWLSRWGRCDKE